MPGNMSQLLGLLRNAGQIRENMQRLQERLKQARYVGEAGGGQVRCTVDGRGEPMAVKIDPALWQSGDAEFVEDLVLAAMRDALTRSREGAQKELEQATGGIDLSGMTGLGRLPDAKAER